MELKRFQRQVLRDLESYLAFLNDPANTLATAFAKFWHAQGVNVGASVVKPYKNVLEGTPHVCFKVPTGGGKTYLACCSVKIMADAICQNRPKVVVWLVPSNAILEQTVKNLQNKDHPYRMRLDVDFGGRVNVLTKEQLLCGQDFSVTSVRENLTVCVLSYDSLRAAKKDGRLVYRENSALEQFANLTGGVPIDGADDTALISALNTLMPMVIVDESHNAESDLSVEMLKNLNPTFVLDLTATPKTNSNIISFVDARALKEENMVKLPVIVYNRNSQEDVLMDALTLQSKLEEAAQAEKESGGAYIRPIVLFQAQPKVKDDARTFQRIKEDLLAVNVPAEQIAIKTSNLNELKGVDLSSPDCPIRFIITVNALKEGWDCPFAYILATLANKTSAVDVEQILGRVLRLPNTRKNRNKMLNMSYVLTCSNDFRMTLDKIVAGLNRAGFTRKDCLVQDTPIEPVAPTPVPVQVPMPEPVQPAEEEARLDITAMREELERRAQQQSGATDVYHEIEETALAQSDAYEASMTTATDLPLAQEVVASMKSYPIQAQFRDAVSQLKLPQFFRHTAESLLSDGSNILLTKEALTKGFRLSEQDAHVDFTSDAAKVAEVDVANSGEGIPKHRLLSARDSRLFRDAVESAPSDKKVDVCVHQICQLLDKDDTLASPDLRAYVKRVVENMNRDDIEAMQHAVPAFATKIKRKIEALQADYRQKQFDEMLETGDVVCEDSYAFPTLLALSDAEESMSKTLYEAEMKDMNGFEYEAIQHIAALENVLWWHRVITKRGFFLNGADNHYPDFIVCTQRGTIVLVETKGEQLSGNDITKQKLHLGRAWQNQLGAKYKYLMVFKSADMELDGAYTLDKALQVMEKL